MTLETAGLGGPQMLFRGEPQAYLFLEGAGRKLTALSTPVPGLGFSRRPSYLYKQQGLVARRGGSSTDADATIPMAAGGRLAGGPLSRSRGGGGGGVRATSAEFGFASGGGLQDCCCPGCHDVSFVGCKDFGYRMVLHSGHQRRVLSDL